MNRLDQLLLEFTALFKNPPTVKIKVLIGDKVVGAIQSLTIHEKRPVNINSFGDVVITPIDIKLETSRIRFDKARIAEAFSRGFFHPSTQKQPLQIMIEDDKCDTHIKNAWLEDNKEWVIYKTGDWVIGEGIDFAAESIESKKK